MRTVRNPLIRAGALILGVLVLFAVMAPTLTRFHVLPEPVQQDQLGLDEDGMPLRPGGHHLLGTDNLGRDVLSQTMHATRVSLTVGLAAMLTATILGVSVGMLAGYYGGRLDLGLMRFTEMSMVIPGILLAYLFVAHDLAVVRHISQRVMVMYLGKILESGEAKAICLSPAHPYTQALLSAVPVVDPVSKRKRIVLSGDVPSPLNPPTGCPFHPRCPVAEARCRSERPALDEISPGHWAACHLAE